MRFQQIKRIKNLNKNKIKMRRKGNSGRKKEKRNEEKKNWQQ